MRKKLVQEVIETPTFLTWLMASLSMRLLKIVTFNKGEAYL